MKKSCLLCLILLFCLSCSKPKPVVVVNNLDDLLNKHFKAIGLDKLLNSNSLDFQYEGNIDDMEHTMNANILIQRPGSFNVWAVRGKDTIFNNYSDNRIDTTGCNHFLQYTPIYIAPVFYSVSLRDSIAFMGRVNADGKDVYRIKSFRFHPVSKTVTTIYYDIDPYDMTLVRSLAEGNPGYFIYENYTEAQGFKYASYFHMKTVHEKSGKPEDMEIYCNIKKLKLNDTYPQSYFGRNKK